MIFYVRVKINKKMLKNNLTPLLRQYLEIKEQNKECLIFFRLGDFYELFFEDAVTASKHLNITLTKRGSIDGKDIPMCGVPHQHGDTYLAKLLKQRFKVAICEQVERQDEPIKRGQKEIIKRKVVRIATPGTMTQEKELGVGNNYLMSISKKETFFSLAWGDISTGDIYVKECFSEHEALLKIFDVNPSELLLKKNFFKKNSVFETNKNITLTFLGEEFFEEVSAKEALASIYNSANSSFLKDLSKLEIQSLGFLIKYVLHTQNKKVPPFKLPKRENYFNYLKIDNASKRNLEIIRSLNGEKEGSLLDCINFTKTSSGERLLSKDITQPLIDIKKIKKRQGLVDFFYKNYDYVKKDISELLSIVPDISRALSRISLGRGGPKDLYSIFLGLKNYKEIKKLLKSIDIQQISEENFFYFLEIDNGGYLRNLINLLQKSLKEKLPLFSREGNFIKLGFDEELDELRKYRDNSKKVILDIEASNRKNTGINNLKIKYNNFLGYFIDITPSSQSIMKKYESEYIHRQTLKNSIRYTSKELIEVSEKILSANFKILNIENRIFESLVNKVKKGSDLIFKVSNIISRLDVSFSWASYSKKYNATKPFLTNGKDYDIEGGRHPSVEKSHNDDFISNNCKLNKGERNIFKLITGPNMSGKSTYLRQNALILIMAQSGGFCPAQKVKLGICDKLFCRVGAGDELAKGNSTFMVEMIETAAILNQATENSFVILDEIGRGTSTYDGISIAWATIEFIIKKIKCKALFATHYHELSALSEKYEELENFTFRIKEWQQELIFLHEIVRGSAESSYGIQVAKKAGIPEAVINEAKIIMKKIKSKGLNLNEQDKQIKIEYDKNTNDNFIESQKTIINKILEINLEKVTPIKAINILYEIKEMIKNKN